VPESWEWPIGVSLSLEAGLPPATFSVDTWTLEVRPIVDQRSLKGENAGRGFAFTPAAKVSYEVTARFAAGLEYYGDIGRSTASIRPRDQQHLIFPVLDVDLGRAGAEPPASQRNSPPERPAHREDDPRLSLRAAAHPLRRKNHARL